MSEKTLNPSVPTEVAASMPRGAARDAVEELGRRIVNDIYPQGEAIPTEPELAVSLGVSRTTIRDAIKVLSGKGMIRTARRYGTKVRPISEWHLLDSDVISWHEPTHSRIGQMFVETTELRCIFEPAAAELAAQRATPEQIGVILDAAHALHPGALNTSELYAEDSRFHCTILDATCNLMMRQLRPMIISILRISYEFGVQTENGGTPFREGHIRVAEAIRDRNGALARHEMEQMLEANRRTANEYWSERKAAGAGDQFLGRTES
ncbi:FCD domain-containing protein [Hoeflea sp. EC-HK425]|jgi:DNA-binding FadR family transcriptional regulator|uniref:FadR/GntR family transcriptional regulator n=1 Tax=Hoeflea sp. EC-HK425 TaxID=2038388 RepID=UPI001251A839|nr:FCD domain-containing protein [Hoeflea sp. EC-HK425]VVT27992.1 Transcriptional regulator, GntR family [Hoeflea sp. EC-HK425]|tara:strand:- start:1386 stop:2180 length:795 start_codon:yes stop_codon:yes gene_type:complete